MGKESSSVWSTTLNLWHVAIELLLPIATTFKLA
jgi:hypothetical protein